MLAPPGAHLIHVRRVHVPRRRCRRQRKTGGLPGPARHQALALEAVAEGGRPGEAGHISRGPAYAIAGQNLEPAAPKLACAAIFRMAARAR